MTEPSSGHASTDVPEDEISLLAIGSILLRRRRLLIGLVIAGAVLGLGYGLLKTRVYVSSATLIPRGSEGATSGLALATSQFGIRVPSNVGEWGGSHLPRIGTIPRST